MNKKCILPICIIFCIITSLVFGVQAEVLANSKKGIKITFDGKTVTLCNSKEPKTLSGVEKKLGKKTRLADGDEEWAGYAYVWEKGKSKLIIMQPSLAIPDQEDYLGYASFEVNDKNISIAGVKVGMKRNTAFKKLKKTYGQKNVKQQKIADSDKNKKSHTVITLNIGAGMPVSYEIKNGKVSSIDWMRS